MSTTGTGKRAGTPAGAIDIEHLKRVKAAQDRAEMEREAAAGKEVAERFAALRRRIVPVELDQQLKERAAKMQLPEDAKIEDRRRRHAAQRSYAAELGVDLVALDALRADFARETTALAVSGSTSGLDLVQWQDESTHEGALATNKRNYDGSWDPGFESYSSNPSQFAIWNADSCFDPATNRAGSHIQFRQRETDNSDWCHMTWRNGYMVLFRPSRNGRLAIDVKLTAQISRFFIDTDDEPGTSACNVVLSTSIEAEVYNSWADTVAQEATWSALATASTTSTENWQDFEAYVPWSTRPAHLETGFTYLSGHTYAVFVSIRNQAKAIKLDDTRVTAGVNSCWYLDDIVVRTI